MCICLRAELHLAWGHCMAAATQVPLGSLAFQVTFHPCAACCHVMHMLLQCGVMQCVMQCNREHSQHSNDSNNGQFITI
jgi:hypothetical protein